MPSATLSIHIRIFLSSPGDVAEERKRAEAVFERLRRDPFLPDNLIIDVAAYDQPGESVPMLATETPQKSVNKNMLRPSECDIVIVIFWTRIGTPLPLNDFRKPNGLPYLSGTEWEYWDGVYAAQKANLPKILVYRRLEKVIFNPQDDDYEKRVEQFSKVEDFFKDFANRDESMRGGYNPYYTPQEFEDHLDRHLRLVINNLLAERQPNLGSNVAQIAPEVTNNPLAEQRQPTKYARLAPFGVIIGLLLIMYLVIFSSTPRPSDVYATESVEAQIALNVVHAASTRSQAEYQQTMDALMTNIFGTALPPTASSDATAEFALQTATEQMLASTTNTPPNFELTQSAALTETATARYAADEQIRQETQRASIAQNQSADSSDCVLAPTPDHPGEKICNLQAEPPTP